MAEPHGRVAEPAVREHRGPLGDGKASPEQSTPEYYNSACILTLAFRFISGFWPPEHELANV